METIAQATRTTTVTRCGFCQWLNLTGFPGLSIPMGCSPEKLPIAVQLIGRPFEEEQLLEVGKILESERGVFPSPPI